MSKMKILKRWTDDPDRLEAQGEPTDWFETTEAECVNHTEGSGYWKTGTVLKMLAENLTVHTPWAEYRADVIEPQCTCCDPMHTGLDGNCPVHGGG